MLGRYAMNDNARTTLQRDATTTDITIRINAAAAPFKLPADPVGHAPSGGVGIATITDSIVQPTKFEIIAYAGLVDVGGGRYDLTGVTRGVAGSSAQNWTAGAVLYQAITADGMLHPFLSLNITDNSTTIGSDELVFPGSLADFSSAVLSANSVSATSATIATINGSSLRVGTQPTTSPVAGALASVSGTNGLAAGAILRTSTDTAGAVLALGKGRGTPVAQTIVINGDTLGRIDAYAARTSAAWSNVASITFETDGSQTTTSMPSRIVFRVAPVNGVVGAEALRINSDSSVTFAGGARFAGVVTFTANVIAGGDVGANSLTANSLDVNGPASLGGMTLSSGVRSVAISAATNDWAPVNFSATGAYRVTTSGTPSITGIASGAANRAISLFNVGTVALTLSHESAGSAAGNRFALPGSANYNVPANDSVTLWYDGTSLRWRVKR